MRFLFIAGSLALAAPLLAAQQPIGRTSATEVQVSGAVDISHGETTLGNGSEITAGNQAVKITLERGGELRLCSTSSVHLSKDRSIDDPANSALMMALNRGAIEANYSVGKYSDVLLTPDLRILISGPGQADLSIRVNKQGDTCVDNHGAGAPYVTVSSELEGGAYRVLPDQRVNFQHGSLREVVDHEPEPCGCPKTPAVNVATAPGGPSSTPADTAFPVAQSEGLAAPPAPHPVPVVPPGEAHVQVTVPLTYEGDKPPAPAAAPPTPAPAPVPAPPPAPAPEVASAPDVASAPEIASAAPAPNPPTDSPPNQGGLFHRIGHFFSKIFGK
jgi:hypothetical protein